MLWFWTGGSSWKESRSDFLEWVREVYDLGYKAAIDGLARDIIRRADEAGVSREEQTRILFGD